MATAACFLLQTGFGVSILRLHGRLHGCDDVDNWLREHSPHAIRAPAKPVQYYVGSAV